MFIDKDSKRGYTRDGQQWASGRFLLLMLPPDKRLSDPGALRGIVRHARLRQLGHFMMGTMFNRVISLSGTYGGDGLPTTVPYPKIYDAGVVVPPFLVHVYATDTDGWNSAGSEGWMMREWALHTFPRRKR